MDGPSGSVVHETGAGYLAARGAKWQSTLMPMNIIVKHRLYYTSSDLCEHDRLQCHKYRRRGNHSRGFFLCNLDNS